MPIKRQAPDSGLPLNSIKASKTKADGSTADYSNDVKKKLSASNRTGQACDRCRVMNSNQSTRPKDYIFTMFSRSVKCAAMTSQRAVHHVCRINRHAGLLIESPALLPHEVMSKASNAGCKKWRPTIVNSRVGSSQWVLT